MGPISENGQSLVKGITQDSTGILANKIGLSVQHLHIPAFSMASAFPGDSC